MKTAGFPHDCGGGTLPPVERPSMPGTGTRVSATGVSVRGRRGAAVHDFAMTAEAGTLTAIAGPAGSGRTSLLLAFAGRMRLAAGEIHVGRHNVRRDPGAAREHVAVARARGENEPDPSDRVGELLDSAGLYVRRRVRGADLTEALDAVRLDPSSPGPASAPPAGAGKTFHRRASFAELHPADQLLLMTVLALLGKPDVVVVDAVDDGLDDTARSRVWSALRSVAERGTTVLATCDSSAAARRAAHQVVHLVHPSGPSMSAGGRSDDEDAPLPEPNPDAARLHGVTGTRRQPDRDDHGTDDRDTQGRGQQSRDGRNGDVT